MVIQLFSIGKQPQCKPITCGQPPEVLNARFYLTNGTSTAWTKKSLESVSFIPQRGENNCAHELTLQKDTRTNCEKVALYSAIVGLIFVLSAIIW